MLTVVNLNNMTFSLFHKHCIIGTPDIILINRRIQNIDRCFVYCIKTLYTIQMEDALLGYLNYFFYFRLVRLHI